MSSKSTTEGKAAATVASVAAQSRSLGSATQLQQHLCVLLQGPFLVERTLTDKHWLFRLQYLPEIFLKMNEVSLSLLGKQLTMFVADNNV